MVIRWFWTSSLAAGESKAGQSLSTARKGRVGGAGLLLLANGTFRNSVAAAQAHTRAAERQQTATQDLSAFQQGRQWLSQRALLAVPFLLDIVGSRKTAEQPAWQPPLS